MFKKIGCILLIAIALFILAWYKPWIQLGLSWKPIVGVDSIKRYSGLTVFSLKDSIEIYIDNELKGKIDASGGSLDIAQLEPGMHRITLRKSAKETNADYYEFTQAINFVEGVSNVIAYELGPSKDFSQGHVFYTQPKSNNIKSDSTYISFLSQISGLEVYLDNRLVGKTPIDKYEISLDKTHEVKIKKTGYEELGFRILPETEEERQKLKDVDLFIELQLFLTPIEVSAPQQ